MSKAMEYMGKPSLEDEAKEFSIKIESQENPRDYLEAPPLETLENEKQKEIWRQVHDFVGIVGPEVRKSFEGYLQTYTYEQNGEERHINPKIINHLKESGLTRPSFQLMYSKEANEFLAEAGLLENAEEEGGITENSALLVFQLPKPLDVYWWRGDSVLKEPQEPVYPTAPDGPNQYQTKQEYEDAVEEYRIALHDYDLDYALWIQAINHWKKLQESVEDSNEITGATAKGNKQGIGEGIIQWGALANRTMKAYHQACKSLELEQSDLKLIRVNDRGQHKPKRYYYAFIVGDEEIIQQRRMPTVIEEDEELIELWNDGNQSFLEKETLEKLKPGDLKFSD